MGGKKLKQEVEWREERKLGDKIDAQYRFKREMMFRIGGSELGRGCFSCQVKWGRKNRISRALCLSLLHTL